MVDSCQDSQSTLSHQWVLVSCMVVHCDLPELGVRVRMVLEQVGQDVTDHQTGSWVEVVIEEENVEVGLF